MGFSSKSGAIFFAVFEARWSEVEWMLNKNVNKDGSEIPEQQGDFVSWTLWEQKHIIIRPKCTDPADGRTNRIPRLIPAIWRITSNVIDFK